MDTRFGLLALPLLCSLGCSSPSAKLPSSADAPDARAGDAVTADATPEADSPPSIEPADERFIVHEWGTLTTRHTKDGQQLWTKNDRVEPLPSFVYENWMSPAKQDAKGTMRLETPVIYFYSNEQREVSVRVEFPEGFLTEWYPFAQHEDTMERASLSWPLVRLHPGPDPEYPVAGESHYYAARETDATPISVGEGDTRQREKLLFYRGVGSATTPLDVGYSEDSVVLLPYATRGAAALLFVREGDKLGFTSIPKIAGPEPVALPELDDNLDDLRAYLRELLILEGLFPREADAMLATWGDLWFEPGRRLIYMLPREATDTLLPLSIEPAPDELVRVIVGRLDLPDEFPSI